MFIKVNFITNNWLDHLFSVKRVNLILLPIWNGIKYEKVQETRDEMHTTFLYLIRVLSMHDLKPFLSIIFELFIKDELLKDKKDSQEMFSNILGILL